MAINILMPALSPTMEEGKLAKWLKREGDSVKPGDVIAEIETDKATMEVEAVDEGTLARILVPEGTENVKVNAPIAIIGVEGEDDVGEGAPASAPRRRRGRAGARSRGACHAIGGASPAPVAAAPRAAVDADPDIPAGTEMVIDDGARGAPRRHGRGDAPRRRRLRHGRGGRRVPGRLQGDAGAARRVRRRPRDRHADHRARLRRPRRRRGIRRPEADRRVHDLQLRHAGDRPDRQLGGEDALHVRRPDGLPDRLPRAERRRRARRRPAQPGLLPPGTARCPG